MEAVTQEEGLGWKMTNGEFRMTNDAADSLLGAVVISPVIPSAGSV